MKQLGEKTCSPEYTWSFKVTLNTADKIVMAKSTTHKLTSIQSNETLTEMVLVMEQS